MRYLDYYYNLDIKKISVFKRKLSLSPNTILGGSSMSGKTYLAFDYLKRLKEPFLYIDIADTRDIKYQDLQSFIDKNKIKHIVLDNYNNEFSLPNIGDIIIISNNYINNNFKYLDLKPLDYEEFILVQNYNANNTNYFNYFLKYGNLPINHKEILLSTQIQKLYKTNLNDIEYKIFTTLIQFSTLPIGYVTIYNYLKTKLKLSKDRFYKTIKTLKNNRYFFQLSKFNYPNATKKIYFYDFSLIEHFTEIDFAKRLENMVLLELLKIDENIYFLDEFTFYIPNQNKAIIPIAFINEDSFLDICDKLYSNSKKTDIKTIIFVTIGYEDKLNIESIRYESIPFWLWATSFD